MPSPPPLRLLVLGVSVDVVFTAGQERLRDELAVRWALCARPDPTGGADLAGPVRRVRIPSLEDTDVAQTGDPADLATTMVATTQAVTRAAIEARRGELLMLHAAGLADPVTGAAVAFVAPGGTGKTTLCRTLGPGRRYLSDETVGIADNGEVVAYPKPLSVRRADADRKDEVDPTTVGLSTAGEPAHVAALVLLDRTADHTGPPEVVELDLFEAIIALCPETSSLARLPAPLHRLERLVHETRPVARVRYAEVRDLEPLVTDLIGPPSRPGR